MGLLLGCRHLLFAGIEISQGRHEVLPLRLLDDLLVDVPLRVQILQQHEHVLIQGD